MKIKTLLVWLFWITSVSLLPAKDLKKVHKRYVEAEKWKNLKREKVTNYVFKRATQNVDKLGWIITIMITHVSGKLDNGSPWE